jgi:hypothetical protein
MATERIGFSCQRLDGTWGPVVETVTDAQRWARAQGGGIRRDRIGVPVLADLPDVPPRPVVVLATGDRVRWNPARSVFVVATTDFPSVVALVRLYPVTDSELDALQALPADTAAWAAAGGRD